MKTKSLIANKLKDGHFWLGIISVAFILSALIIFAIDRINGSVSYEYIAAAMVCIYVAALCVFADLSSVRIKENKKYRVIYHKEVCRNAKRTKLACGAMLAYYRNDGRSESSLRRVHSKIRNDGRVLSGNGHNVYAVVVCSFYSVVDKNQTR